MRKLIYIRHGERPRMQSDQTLIDNWKKSERYKENSKDEPLTELGHKESIKTGIELLKRIDIEEYPYIYSSPATRCIETAINIINAIEKIKGIKYKIRIVYDLMESINTYFIPALITFNGKKPTINYYEEDIKDGMPFNIIDKKMTLPSLIKRYGEYIDKDYKTNTKINIDPHKRINNTLKEIDRIIKKNAIVVAHGGSIFERFYCYLLQNKFDLGETIKLNEKTRGHKTCNFVCIFEKDKGWKVTFGPKRIID